MVNTNRLAKAADYYITRNARTTAVIIIEVSFLSNPKEEKLLKDSDYRTKLAFSIYKGIVKYYNNLSKGTSA
ncbi:MAG: N-acetylmuramoyl-L-alanine amidase [Desulfotomaculum sp.]|nr:N-acetylmuramoyl-L-alanine amidase [Desulfotomaculum sp.]MCL0106515.1 N-acetylmuramoyl-L-alanine amidase [Peptococcaceae bacterium]